MSAVGTLPPRLRINCLNPCSVRGYSVDVVVFVLGLAEVVVVVVDMTGAAAGIAADGVC